MAKFIIERRNGKPNLEVECDVLRGNYNHSDGFISFTKKGETPEDLEKMVLLIVADDILAVRRQDE